MRKHTRDVAARRRECKRAGRRRRSKKPRQLEFFYTGPPGKHRFDSGEKVGRPPEEGAGPRHEERPALNPRHPLHVTIKVLEGLPSIRRARESGVVRGAIAALLGRSGTRLVAWSVQTNHVHLLRGGRQGAPAGV